MRWDLHLDLTLQIPLVEKATVGLAHYSHGKVRTSGLFMCNTLCFRRWTRQDPTMNTTDQISAFLGSWSGGEDTQ